MDVDGGNTNSHTLTGLTNGQTYTIFIVGTSSSSAVLPGAPVSAGAVHLCRSKWSIETGSVNSDRNCSYNSLSCASFFQ